MSLFFSFLFPLQSFVIPFSAQLRSALEYACAAHACMHAVCFSSVCSSIAS